jgi:hypothetical protein
VYVEALATVSASAELELVETRDALRDAREEAAEVSECVARTRRERDGFREEAERLKREVEHETALRSLDKKAHDAEMQSVTRRAEKAEAELRRREASCASARGEGGGAAEPPRTTAVCDATGPEPEFDKSRFPTPNAVDPIEPSEPPVMRNTSTTLPKHTNEDETARAFAAVETHRRSMRAHLDALRRDREMLATTNYVV